MVLTTNYPVLVLLTRAYTIKIEGSYRKLRQQNLVSLIVTYCNGRLSLMVSLHAPHMQHLGTTS